MKVRRETPVYFKKDPTVRSLEWSNFRIEINELVFFLIKLSDKSLVEFLNSYFTGEENDKTFRFIANIKNSRTLIDYLFTENEKYRALLFEKIKQQPAICRENSEAMIRKGYRASQVVLADSKNRAGFYRSKVQTAEEPNDNERSNLPPYFLKQ